MTMVTELAPQHTLTFSEALAQAEILALQALPAELHERISCGMALVREGKVMQVDAGHWEVESATTVGQVYSVNGVCSCPDAHYRAVRGLCKHRVATYLARKSLELIEASQPPATAPVPVEVEASAVPVPGIPAHFLTTIQGRPFVRFEGLLSLAHERGLVELSTTVVTVSSDFAVCQSTARFKDGLVVTDIGDASPTNVKKHLAPHFVRMAATRASARALRRALNIDAVAVEELGEDV